MVQQGIHGCHVQCLYGVDLLCCYMCCVLFRLLYKWSGTEDRPKNGSLVQLITKGGLTEFVVVPSSV